MSHEFSIESSEGKRVVFDSPRFNDDGWLDWFRLTLESPKVTVTVEVENPPYWPGLTDYFLDLAKHWRAWKGTKKWQAAEGEFRIETVMSKTGHASMKFTVYVDGAYSDWAVMGGFDIESGQLDKIAGDAKKFFSQSKSVSK